MVNNQTVNDLENERKKCCFRPLELTYLLDGGQEKTEERRTREKVLLDCQWESSIPIGNLSHKEKYEEAVRKACLLYSKFKTLMPDWHSWQDTNPRDNITVSHLLQDGNPFAVHVGLFLPTILWQGTPEQHEKWLSRAWNFEIIGTYAQTELGHGTNIRALETTAVYDPNTQEFVLNTPSLTSYKWWPGGLGHTANYTIVIAQLYTKGKCHGVHAFLVQVRDEATHMPLEGVKIGEIGPKMGYSGTNNGFLEFKNVRIPRDQMLMRNSQVLPDGTYVPPKNVRLVYGTMIFVRVLIVIEAGHFLRHATTIATRYSAVRRQTNIQAGTPEVQVLDFITQQYKIFPTIASAFAFHYVGEWLWKMYINLVLEMENDRFSNLPEFHAMSCVMKAITSSDSAEGVETCRKACGGHGYATSSGFPFLYGNAAPMITYEGENTVLYLQTARFLLKSWQNKDNLQNLATVKYLMTALEDTRPFQKSVEWIAFTLKKAVAGALDSASNHIMRRVADGDSLEQAASRTSIQLVQAAELHGRANAVEIFYNAIKNVNASADVKAVLVQLMELYSVDTFLKSSGWVFKYSNTRDVNTEILQQWLEDLLIVIRPNAVGIVDGFDIHDEVLGSALGASDGRVYERIFAEAAKSPLNSEPVNQSFDLHLKDFFKLNLKSRL